MHLHIKFPFQNIGCLLWHLGHIATPNTGLLAILILTCGTNLTALRDDFTAADAMVDVLMSSPAIRRFFHMGHVNVIDVTTALASALDPRDDQSDGRSEDDRPSA